MGKMAKKAVQHGFFGVLCLLCVLCAVSRTGQAKAVLKERSVKVGQQISFTKLGKGYTLRSSDAQIAYVSADGIITGKKTGTVTVTASKAGHSQRFTVTVLKNGRKPSMRVCTDELISIEPKIVKKNGEKVLAFTVKNSSKKGTAKKVVCQYQLKVVCETEQEIIPTQEPAADDEVTDKYGSNTAAMKKIITKTISKTMNKTVSISFGKIAAGKKKVVYYSKWENPKKISKVTLKSVTVYSGDAKMKWNPQSDKTTYSWAAADKKAPVISGFVGKNSYNGKDIYVVLYEDRKTAYKKYVSAVDERDGKVAVTADLSKINWKKTKNYTITLRAEDRAGNVAKKKMKVQVRCLLGVDAYADTILKRITKSGWSDIAKCKAIYKYVHAHMSYVDYNGGKSWESAAIRAMRYQNGNCYAHYGLARALLTRAGIPNIMITRYPAQPNHHHWWNLAYVQGGWYHFDTTPRRLQGRFCLLTDAQLRIYGKKSPSAFRFKSSAYPKRATKVICSGPF